MSHNGGPGNNASHPNYNGMDLLYTNDGKEWKLLKRLWPVIGMYSTLAELDVDSSGAALTFGTFFTGGFLGKGEYVLFMNFTSAELATPTEALLKV